MVIGKLVESIFTKVNGFRPSTDNSILRVDIRTMLPVAINAAMDGADKINRQEGDDLPGEFYGTYEKVPIDYTGRIPFITLTEGTIPMRGNNGVRFVYDDCGGQYGVLTDSDMGSIEYYCSITKGMRWFRRTGNKLNLYGTNPDALYVNYQALTSVDALSDDDEAPIQAGMEPQVVSLLVSYFTDNIRYDNIIDTKNDLTASR